MKIDTHTVSGRKIVPGLSISAMYIQIVREFTQWATPNLDFNVKIFFKVKYLEDGTRQSCTYNGRLIGSRTWSIEWYHFKWSEWPLTQISRSRHYSTFSVWQSHRLERVVPTGPFTMFQLLIGLIQSRDNRGRHVLSSDCETTEVEGYENGLMPVFRCCLKLAYADFWSSVP